MIGTIRNNQSCPPPKKTSILPQKGRKKRKGGQRTNVTNKKQIDGSFKPNHIDNQINSK